MSIKNNKEITLLPKKKNRKIILVIEDEYDWCFPDCIWQYIKDFVGIFSKVNCIDKPFLRNIRFAIEYETPGRFIQKYINHMSLDPETKLVSEALVASGVLVENYNLTNLTLTKIHIGFINFCFFVSILSIPLIKKFLVSVSGSNT